MKMIYNGDGPIRVGDMLVSKGEIVDLSFVPSKNFSVIASVQPEPVKPVPEKQKPSTQTEKED